MSGFSKFTCVIVVAVACFGWRLPQSAVDAQAARPALVARAVLPAETLADGPRAGQAFAQRKTVNSLKMPFDTQPVGSITGIVPGSYSGSWQALMDGVFDTPENSRDYWLRVYTIQIEWRRGDSGDGVADVVDWITLTDPNKKANKNVVNASSKNRELTGADYIPRAMFRLGDDSMWIAEAAGPSLLHVGPDGKLLEAPIPLSGAKALQGASGIPGKPAMYIAQRVDGKNSVTVRPFDLQKKQLGPEKSAIPLENGSNLIGGITMINDNQLVMTEQDSKENKNAGFKQVFLVDLSTNPAKKTQLIDLLNIADPSKISTASVFKPAPNSFGLGDTFKFPFQDIPTVYPGADGTLVLVNNNNVPLGVGRSGSDADDTEFIQVQIAQRLTLDSAVPLPR